LAISIDATPCSWFGLITVEVIAKLFRPVIPAKAGIKKPLFLEETGFPDQVGE
jgi:hypothetical protein